MDGSGNESIGVELTTDADGLDIIGRSMFWQQDEQSAAGNCGPSGSWGDSFSNLQAYQCFAGTVFTDDSCYGGSASTAGIGVCTVGKIACTGGVITGCEGEVLPSAEICDGVDNDCDGLGDDDDLSLDTSTYNIYYLDSDGDGYGTLVTTESACTPSESYVANALDCDDDDATVYSGHQSFAMGRLITVLLELFLPMRVMTMVMAS